MKSVMMNDVKYNLFWYGLNLISDFSKMIILKMPETGVVTYNIKF